MKVAALTLISGVKSKQCQQKNSAGSYVSFKSAVAPEPLVKEKSGITNFLKKGLQGLVKLINVSFLKEKLLKTYTKETDFGNAIAVAYKLQSKKNGYKVKKELFSSEIQEILNKKIVESQNRNVSWHVMVGKKQFAYEFVNGQLSIYKVLNPHLL